MCPRGERDGSAPAGSLHRCLGIRNTLGSVSPLGKLWLFSLHQKAHIGCVGVSGMPGGSSKSVSWSGGHERV